MEAFCRRAGSVTRLITGTGRGRARTAADFKEGVDFVAESRSPNLGSKKHGGHNVIEYYLTLRMAEHLSMMNNDIGFAVRDYFIDVEKDWRARGGSLLSSRIVDSKRSSISAPKRSFSS